MKREDHQLKIQLFLAKLFKQYGLCMLPFIIFTLPLYVIYDTIWKQLEDPYKLWSSRRQIPIVAFTPSARIFIGTFNPALLLSLISEIYLLECYKRHPRYEIKPSWVVLDVGAHMGVSTLYAADHHPRLIIALEPDSRSYPRLVKTLKINGLNDIVLLPYAMTGEDAVKPLFLSDITGRTHIVDARVKGIRIVRVKTITIETIIRTFNLHSIDLLKLDVEGSEHEIVSSSSSMLQEGVVKRIVAEVHGRTDEFIERLEALDFKIDYLQRKPRDFAFIHARCKTLGVHKKGHSSNMSGWL